MKVSLERIYIFDCVYCKRKNFVSMMGHIETLNCVECCHSHTDEYVFNINESILVEFKNEW